MVYIELKLKNIVDNHILWLKDSLKGEKALFKGCDLGKVDFRNYNLKLVNFEGDNLRGVIYKINKEY